ncbi:MAG TPA: ATP-binding protein [Candidatus Binatia bacterium]|nr:ATP-binding protein [Candidatus Binatia bacterium]
MRLRPRTLRARLTLWYTVFLSGMLALLGVVALVLLDRGLRDNVDASLGSVARSIAESTRGPSRFGPDLDETLESLLGPGFAERFFRLLDPFGRPDPRVGQRGRVQLPLSPEALRNAEDGRETYETLVLPGVSAAPVRLLTLPVIEHGRIVHLVQVAMPLESAEAARSHFLFILLGLTPVALGGAGAGGWFLARRALAPVDTMVETARKIEAGDLSRRIETPESNDELGRLAAVLNDMLVRLERSFTAVRHFSADAAHELRTPLTILKGELEVALRSGPAEQEYQRVLGSCLEEVDRLSALVEDLLFLARSDSGNLNPAQSPLDLAEVLEEVVPALRALAETAGVTLTVPAPPAVWVRGNRPMLFRLLFNLAENAIKYTPAGGTVEVELGQGDSVAKLTVRDTGPGIAPEEQARIFDRFYRGDPARERGGTGLGLALARSIVLVHNGQINVESTPGQGSCFSVTLPRLASQDL